MAPFVHVVTGQMHRSDRAAACLRTGAPASSFWGPGAVRPVGLAAPSVAALWFGGHRLRVRVSTKGGGRVVQAGQMGHGFGRGRHGADGRWWGPAPRWRRPLRPVGPTVGGTHIRRPRRGRACEPRRPTRWSCPSTGRAARRRRRRQEVLPRRRSDFVQPSIVCTGSPVQFAAAWVGLDGVQRPRRWNRTGRSPPARARATGPPAYVAWYEMYPAGSIDVFPVRRVATGIEPSVSFADRTFTVSITDATTRPDAVGPGLVRLVSPGLGRMEIIELSWPCAPKKGSCFLSVLPDFDIGHAVGGHGHHHRHGDAVGGVVVHPTPPSTWSSRAPSVELLDQTGPPRGRRGTPSRPSGGDRAIGSPISL